MGFTDILALFARGLLRSHRQWTVSLCALLTPLHEASYSGYLEIVQLLVQHGAALDNMNADQETPLLVASHLGIEVACFLIGQGANTMSEDKDGNMLLHNASRHGHLDLVEMLLEGSTDANMQNAEEQTVRGWTPLHTAAQNGHLDTVQLLPDHGIGVQVRNGNHETPLILASMGGHVEIMDEVLGCRLD
jgi:ankyrin repeat protein